MDFSFSEPEELFRKSVRDFCEKRIQPRADEIDEKGEIPREVLEDMGDLASSG